MALRLRLWSILAAVGLAATACFELIDVSLPDAGAPDAATPDAAPVDATLAAPDAGAAADGRPGCIGGGFCDPCAEDLVLCVRFDGGIADESRYRRSIDASGAPPVFVNDNGLGAVQLDGGVRLTVPGGDGLSTFDALTIEVLLRVRVPLQPGQRYAVVDDDYGAAIFLIGGAVPFIRCNDVNRSTEPLGDGWRHVACVTQGNDGGSATEVFLDGARIGAPPQPTTPVPRAGQGPLFLFSNDPTGLDAFVGEVATLRIYRSAKTDLQIREAGSRDGATD